MIEIIDEFIFSWSSPGPQQQNRDRDRDRGGSNSKKRRLTGKLTSIQQLHLTHILADYFTGGQDFNLLCSVFMIIFMVQGKDVEFKVSCLSRLISLAVSMSSAGDKSVTILNFAGVWLTQQSPTSGHSLSLARHLVSDTLTMTCDHHLDTLPAQSPLFTTNLIAAIGELYSINNSVNTESPPVKLVSLVTGWLRSLSSPSSSGSSSSLSVPTPETSPAAALLPWSVLCFLEDNVDTEHRTVISQLQLTLVDIIISSPSSQLPVKYLSQLTESLLSRLEATKCSQDNVDKALDYYGQIVAAALAGDKLKIDKDMLANMKKLPDNRLVKIVLDMQNR